MDTGAIVKAGGVGAGVVFILNLLGFIPCLGCFTWLLVLLAYAGTGVLAAYWMLPPRTGGSGAKNGAAAAVVASLIAGFITLIINGIYFAVTGGASQLSQVFADLPPEQLAALAEMGIDPGLFAGAGGIGLMMGVSLACCAIGVLIAAGLGAAGGAFWGNSHPN
jgi:hypothetical protein